MEAIVPAYLRDSVVKTMALSVKQHYELYACSIHDQEVASDSTEKDKKKNPKYRTVH